MKAFSFRTFTPWWTALLSLLVLAGCGSDDNPISPTASQVSQVSSVNSQVPQNVFSGTLTGTEEVPSVTSNGSGTGIVSVDPATNQMKATIVTADINGTQAHIHVGARGVAGPVVFPMTESETGSGIWTTTVTLTADQLNQLKSGNYYFNVHTAAFPEGEIRGQILAQLPQSGSPINITGSASTTANTSSGGSSAGATGAGTDTSGTAGTAGTAGTVSPSGTTGTGTLGSTSTGATYPVTSAGISSSGSSGVPGTQASGQATGSASTDASSSGTSATGGTATAAATANRAVFYTNVLSGSLVVPANASTASATGIAAYRPNNRTLTAVIVSQGLTATGANIRQAAAGVNGPVVGSFTKTSAGSGIWVVRATLTTTQAEALSNGAMYYELLSATFPDGELRGQIVKTQGTTTPAAPATPATPATPGTSGTPTTPATPATPSTGATPTPTTTTPTTPTTPAPTTTTPTTPTTTMPTTTTPTTTTPTTTTPTTTTPTTTTPGDATTPATGTTPSPTTTNGGVTSPTGTSPSTTTDTTATTTTTSTATTTPDVTPPPATSTTPTVTPITTITGVGGTGTTP